MSKDMKLIMEHYRKNVGGQDVSLEDKFKKIEEFKLSSLNPMNWFKSGSPYSDKMTQKWWSIHGRSGIMKSSWKDHPVVAEAFIDFTLRKNLEHIRKVTESPKALGFKPMGDAAKAKVMRYIKNKQPLRAFEQLVVEKWNNLQEWATISGKEDAEILNLLSDLSSAQIQCEVHIAAWDKEPGGLGHAPFKDQFKEVASLAKDYSQSRGKFKNPDYGEGPFGYRRDPYLEKGIQDAQSHLKKLDEKFERDKEVVENNKRYFTKYRTFLMIDSLEDMINELEDFAAKLENTYGYDGLSKFADELGIEYNDWNRARKKAGRS